MSKRGLPTGVTMRHDSHYVEEFARTPNRSIGKIIPIGQIVPNPNQPRVEIGELAELADSIKQKGVLEPLLVKPNPDGTWMIIAGERRWRASNLAGLREVPCIELDVDEQTVAEIALIENLQRKDLNVWEEADGLAALGSRYGYTHEEIAAKIGKSRSTVTEFFTIAGLPETIRAKCRGADINSKSTLLEIARQFDEKAMYDFLKNLTHTDAKRDDRQQVKKQQKDQKVKVKNELKNIERSFEKDLPDESGTSATTFCYASVGNDFTLEINFLKMPDYNKRDILKALKEAFDAAKQSE